MCISISNARSRGYDYMYLQSGFILLTNLNPKVERASQPSKPKANLTRPGLRDLRESRRYIEPKALTSPWPPFASLMTMICPLTSSLTARQLRAAGLHHLHCGTLREYVHAGMRGINEASECEVKREGTYTGKSSEVGTG
jgi:hypothetical protein